MIKSGTQYLNTCNAADWIIADPDDDFTPDAECTGYDIATMGADETAYITRDMGIGYFGTTFEIQWSSLKAAGGDKARCVICAVSNNIDGTTSSLLSGNDGMGVFYGINLSQTYIRLYDFITDDNDIYYQGAYSVPQRWFTLVRSGATATLYTYDDEARTNLIRTQVISCSLIATFRYLHVVGGNGGTSETDPHTGWNGDYQIISH